MFMDAEISKTKRLMLFRETVVAAFEERGRTLCSDHGAFQGYVIKR
jgi:hypothetical protein